MKRMVVLGLATFLVLSGASGQKMRPVSVTATFKIMDGKKKIGELKSVSEIRKDGSSYSLLDGTMTIRGIKARGIQKTETDANGRPKSADSRFTALGRAGTHRTETYGADAVVIRET